MKNLYVSDLDGTLMDRKGELSDYSRQALGKVLERGIPFTVATARSVASVSQCLKGVPLALPIIEFNGAFITEMVSGKHLTIEAIEYPVLLKAAQYLKDHGLHFLVSSYDGKRDRLYYDSTHNEGEEWYVGRRYHLNDLRLTKVDNVFPTLSEQVVCLTAINRKELLQPVMDSFSGQPGLELHLQENAYSPGWYWLTMHSSAATKDQAIVRLQKMFSLEETELTVFGDNTNDLKMMHLAKNAVAPANAVDAVLQQADEIILPHFEDGVVKYIMKKEGFI